MLLHIYSFFYHILYQNHNSYLLFFSYFTQKILLLSLLHLVYLLLISLVIMVIIPYIILIFYLYVASNLLSYNIQIILYLINYFSLL